ncbi:transcriptional regulator, LysR family protein [Roseovarius sp. TM1035]|uniref:LysR family transcriptional regulator n=1 Tax=Roseovarius TaxID=74030 RepID=UPI00015574A7|nr:LysR family transcriptional regulator [Roseovarius sp. TM1035]AWZ21255.1 Transcriptional regulator, LysR family [Roseovarius sp. AK1035]EDM30748.1 transcriptional regulator, LysR family protein [Roseovarius sp. TM1035]|tara:strand:- start:2500 stop:3405 length:906 start_codon:yes stop_codon:yes gene_type:complete
MIRTEALRAFVTVTEHGNIRDAAEILCRTQSAVSMTLKQLEAELGGPLFESDRKSKLTDLGTFVLDVVGPLLRDHDRALELITGYARGYSGRLRIAAVPSVAALILPAILKSFVEARPEAEIDLYDTDSASVREMLLRGDTDLGLASPAAEPDGLRAIPLFTDALVFVCNAAHPLAAETRPLAWHQLSGERLILNETLSALSTPEFKTLAARARLSVRNLTSLLAMVQADAGDTILPGLATRALPDGVVTRPLADAACLRRVSLLVRDGRTPSPVAAAFIDMLCDALPDMAQRFGLREPWS